jgi:hypothetical protein
VTFRGFVIPPRAEVHHGVHSGIIAEENITRNLRSFTQSRVVLAGTHMSKPKKCRAPLPERLSHASLRDPIIEGCASDNSSDHNSPSSGSANRPSRTCTTIKPASSHLSGESLGDSKMRMSSSRYRQRK